MAFSIHPNLVLHKNMSEEKGKQVTSAIVAAGAAGVATAGATGSVGAVGALLGCTAAGIAKGSALAGMMSAASSSALGTAVVATLQSAGTAFAATTGGSVLIATAAVAAPIVATGAVLCWLWPKGSKKGKKNEKEKKLLIVEDE